MIAMLYLLVPLGAMAYGQAPNLLASAEITSNLHAYTDEVRGESRDMVWDPVKDSFVRDSQWHEYGVAFGADLGVVAEATPAWWMAEWDDPVEVNWVCLSGAYPNQPQPRTAWVIEARMDGRWQELGRGAGGWYDSGQFEWGGRGAASVWLDGFRVRLFSPDSETSLSSIHLRGEAGVSWVVARLPSIEVAIRPPSRMARATRPVSLGVEVLAGAPERFVWDFGDGSTAEGPVVEHTYAKPGAYEVRLTCRGGGDTASARYDLEVGEPMEIALKPLHGPVMVGEPVTLEVEEMLGSAARYVWRVGDVAEQGGARKTFVFARPGVYHVLVSADGMDPSQGSEMLIRVCEPQTVSLPQVLLDTDQKNEQDDQHYLAYALFSELDVLGVNSVHHGGGQEELNYEEILNVIDLCRRSGLPSDRVPLVFRGADERLVVPASGRWEDTEPIVTEASRAILAAARGADPAHPVWVLPVGPGTNVASALLMARREGLDLEGRLRIMWLAGNDTGAIGEFNANNDPWSGYVMAQSGIEFWIMPAHVSGRLMIDVTREAHLYPDNPLGDYLERIVPRHSKSLFDPCCLAAVIAMHLGREWVLEVTGVALGGQDANYQWTPSDDPKATRVIWEIDQEAMKVDLFDTLRGRPTNLVVGGGE
ncbi:MAG: PKD domain-containing protein [Acidobacteriota bacterium]|nr:PKD domain-containing protein [Acidobacteriota bacterium]